jgi:hypothetical protein
VLKLLCAARYGGLYAQAQGAAYLCAALGNPEASHDLIKAQQGALLLGDIPQSLHKWATIVCIIQPQQRLSTQLAQGRARQTLLNSTCVLLERWRDNDSRSLAGCTCLLPHLQELLGGRNEP